MTLASAPATSVHLAPPHLTIAWSIVDSADTVAISIRHGGADHLICVSIERSDLSASDVLLLTDPPMAEVPTICDRAARRARVWAVRALVAGDTARYRLLSAVEVALHNYACSWQEALSEEVPSEGGLEVLAS
jgi:hypothetical protein